jgi:PAS domain S-box-containing protein
MPRPMTKRRRDNWPASDVNTPALPPASAPPAAPSADASDALPSGVRASVDDAALLALVHATGTILWTMPADGVIRAPVASWLAYTGQGAADACGDGWLDAVHPKDRTSLSTTMASGVASGASYGVECRVRRFDGAYRWCAIQGTPVRDATGTIREWVGLCTDITDRKRTQDRYERLLAREREARHEIEAARAHLQAVLDVLPVGVVIANARGRMLAVNAAVRRIWGEDVPLARSVHAYRNYRAWWSASGEEVAPADWAMTRAITRGEVSLNEELDIESFDGQRKSIVHTGAPIRDADGRIIGGVTAMLDITEMRRLERRTREAFRALVAMAGALVQPVSPPADEESALPADALGHHPPLARHVARQLVELIQTVLDAHVVAMASVEHDTQALGPITVVGMSPDAERQWWDEVPRSTLLDYVESASEITRLQAGEFLLRDIALHPFPQRSDYGIRTLLIAPIRVGEQVIGVFGIEHHDAAHTYSDEELALLRATTELAALVLERERLLREREEARANELALRTVNERMDEFLGMATHDLRSPVASSKLNVQLALRQFKRTLADLSADGAAPPPSLLTTQSALRTIERSMDRLARLVDRLLDVSRVRSGRLDIRLAPSDLATIVREAVEEQRMLAPQRAIHLHMPDEAASVPVLADADRLGEVVTNYLTNALRYAPEDRPIAVTLSIGDAVARVAVRDEGPGIPLAEQERIWRSFERVHSAEHPRAVTGLGLGLYISREIVAGHGGQAGVESEEGHGATFWFTLPLSHTP